MKTIRCHWCHQELEEQYCMSEDTIYECPLAHCTIHMDTKTQTINKYTIFVDHDDKRYKILSHKSGPTYFWLKTEKPATSSFYRDWYGTVTSEMPSYFEWKEVLVLNRHFSLKPNKEGVLEGKALFNKLKTLLLFS